MEGKAIRYAVRINDGPEQTVNYATEGRSEEWKENVLRNQAIRNTSHIVDKKVNKPSTSGLWMKVL
ncbi:hypothetical protein LWM68_10175 [Niabella sp. W65]|nr:hypothetical protein [Niabella sp. W65]MCH7363103.1 hypothetical protein [Niabella sp. W65]ULT39031.1 hypothetical protein KRR40_28870 [Niabella sp. I65]